MEFWKIAKFSETASYLQLLETEAKLTRMIEEGLLEHTNARAALEVLRQTIELRKLFGEEN